MQILVSPTGWGDAQTIDIERLLMDTASHLNRFFRIPFDGTIKVVPAAEGQPPEIRYRDSPVGPFLVLLPARDRFWAQYAFQFAHEFCHILSGYERLRDNPNNWFSEAICELASVFNLRRMADAWRTVPPYSHWTNYGPNLWDYAQQRLSQPQVQLLPGVSFQNWLLATEEKLRRDPYQRDLNAVVAYHLLPLFEKEPNGWNAVASLPNSFAHLADYLRDWHMATHPGDKSFVAKLADELAYNIVAER